MNSAETDEKTLDNAISAADSTNELPESTPQANASSETNPTPLVGPRKPRKSVSFSESVPSEEKNGRKPGSLASVTETETPTPAHFVGRQFLPSIAFSDEKNDVKNISTESRRSLIADAIISSILITLYILSIVLSLLVAVYYYENENNLWYLPVLLLVVIPSPITQFASFRFGGIANDDFIILLHIFQLGILARYVKLIYKSLRWSRDAVIHQTESLSTLGLFHGFLSTGPQLLLQLYLAINTDSSTTSVPPILIASICIQGATFSFCLAFNQIESRATLMLKSGRITALFLYRFFILSSRAVAIATFAVQNGAWIFLILGVHAVGFIVINSAWIRYTEHQCLSPFGWLQACALAYLHVYDFLNWTEGQTRYRYLIYYSALFLENTLLFIFWFSNENQDVYGVLAACLVWGGFALGIAFMVLYYQYLHPNQWEKKFTQLIMNRRSSSTSLPQSRPNRQGEAMGKMSEEEEEEEKKKTEGDDDLAGGGGVL